jgi:SagB-type dehydrogenase family enzyme
MARLASLALLALLLTPARPRAAPNEIALPPPRKAGPVNVESALATRRSVRTYTKQALTLEEVGQLLWAAQGVTGPEGRRTAPSAKRRYPLEIAVVAQNVEGLPGGAYRYLPAKHALALLSPGKGGQPLLSGATPQPQVSSAPAVFVVAAVYERMDTGSRSQTWSDYEAGLASENLLLEAVALGLGAVVTGGIDPALAREALKLANNEQVIVLIPVGHPG